MIVRSNDKSDDIVLLKTERFTAVKRSVFIFIAATKKHARIAALTLFPIFTLIIFLYWKDCRIFHAMCQIPPETDAEQPQHEQIQYDS